MGLTAGTLTWMLSLVSLLSPPAFIMGAESLERLATEPDLLEDIEFPAARGASRPSAAAAAAFLLRLTSNATTAKQSRRP